MSQILQDFRYAFRNLAGTTSLTAVAVLTLGIAANCAIFSIVNTVLLQPFDYENPDQIVRLWQRYWLESADQAVHFSEVELVDLRDKSQVFSEIGGYFVEPKTLITDQHPEQVLVARISPAVFSLLGIPAAEGRTFLPAEEEPGKDKVALLSHQTVQRRFGGEKVIGKTLRVDDVSYEVVGVMPSDFRFPPRYEIGGAVELWIPETIDRANLPTDRDGAHGRYLSVLARLAPGVTVEQAQQAMDSLGKQFQAEFPSSYMESKGYGMEVLPLLEAEVASIRPALWALFGTGILTLLITCFNVGILLLTQAYKRRREFALRSALGAGRQRILSQLVTEGVVLALVGGALGLTLAYWLLQTLLGALPPEIPRLDEVSIDFAVFGFTLLIVIFAGFLSGLTPLFLISRVELAEELKQGGTRTVGGGRGFRNGLLAAEIAIALVVLIATGLLIKNFLLLRERDPGFDTEGRLTMKVTMPLSKYNTYDTIVQFQNQILEQIEGLPGIEKAGFVSHLPLDGTSASWGITVEGFPIAPDEGQHQVDFQIVSPGYHEAMGIELIEGEPFPDPGKDGPPWYVIVDERLARQYWPDESAVGKRIRRGREKHGRPWATIVGVARHVKTHGVNDDSEREQVYYPHTQVPYPYITLVVQSDLEDPTSLAGAVRKEIAEVDREQPIGTVRMMETWVAESLTKPRFSMLLFLLFATIAILLVIGGAYGLFNALTLERRRDIGIQIALGATRKDVIVSVLRQCMFLAAIGIVIGIGLALGGTQFLESQLYGVSTVDVVIFVAMPLALISILLVATLLPARRAAKTDPMRVLREE